MRSFLTLLSALAVSTLSLSAQSPAPAPVKKAAAITAKAAPVPAPAAMKNFKESGSASAPVTVEIYTDYMCPACRELYLTILPDLVKQYVNTGKVRLIHRDFPLSQHQFSRVAARYANAAGEIGKYDLVANQLFQTQAEWDQNGNIEASLAKVLSPADLKKIGEIAKNDPRLDDSVETDMALGNRDALRQTPTIVIVAKGKREVIAGVLPFNIMKSYLDRKLAQ
jgi:protein-disulfide isomerase